MITRGQANKLKELINEYCDSKIDYSLIDNYAIEDQPDVEYDVAKSLYKLNDFIEGLTNDNKCQN